VVGDKDIVQFGELPMTWGLMVPHTKNTLKIVKPAVINKNPESVDMSFMCAILRRATQQLTDRAVKNVEFQRGYDGGFKEGKKELDYLRESKNDQLDTLKRRIKEFKESSGVDIDDWRHSSKQVGDAVRMVLNGKHKRELENLEMLKDRVLHIADEIKNEINKHKEIDLNKEMKI